MKRSDRLLMTGIAVVGIAMMLAAQLMELPEWLHLALLGVGSAFPIALMFFMRHVRQRDEERRASDG